MEHSNKNPGETHVAEAASELLNEGKKFAKGLYDQGVDKVNEAEESVKEYTDELLQKIQKNPLSSVLIAAGVGFLLSKIFKI